MSYYFAITLEAFIFCFAGEFLSAKVRKRNVNIHVYYFYVSNMRDLYFKLRFSMAVSLLILSYSYKFDLFRKCEMENCDNSISLAARNVHCK